MHRIVTRTASVLILLILAAASLCHAQSSSSSSPVSISVYDRTRVDTWQWFAAPPESSTYGYIESLVRIGVAQPAVLDAPSDAVSPVIAQGQLGLGGTYYASNANSYPAAAFLKRGFVRFNGEGSKLRVGRFEFSMDRRFNPRMQR